MTPDIRDFGNLSLNKKQEESRLPDLKTILSLANGIFLLKVRISSFFIFQDVFPRNGRIIVNSNFGTVWTSSFFSWTGKPLNGMQVFTPLQHVRSNSCTETKISRENFQIIGHEKDKYLVQLKESILISTSRPQLNGNLYSVPLSLFAS